MADSCPAILLEPPRAIWTGQRDMRAKIDEAATKPPRDIDNVSRQLRHLDADRRTIDDRIADTERRAPA